jgi:malonyl-CoA/methylmalonyl-CoA synthetase
VTINLYDTLRAGFAPALDRPALRVPGGPVLTYRHLDDSSARYAAALREAGVRAGARVVVQVDKSPDAVALYLGCLRIGAIYVPLNTAYTAVETTAFLEDAEPALFVGRPEGPDPSTTCPGLATASLGADGAGTLADQARACQPFAALTPVAPDDTTAILYTSGTTGRSKGAMLTRANLESNARTLYRLWGWRPDDVLLHALPVFHVHGLFVALHCAFLGGSPVVFHPRFDASTTRASLREASVMMGVPTFYSRLLDIDDFGAADCTGMRLFISGSAPLLPSTFETFAARTGHRILERYGMTETGMITSNPLDGERIAGTVGFALPGVEVRVTGNHGQPLPPDTVGAVEVRGPNVFRGYWRMPEKTAEDFRPDGFFVTGDLGRLAPDGRLTLAGRAKDLIIAGGYNIYPKEVEACLDDSPGVLESAVIGIPHKDLGEAVLAVVVPETGAAVSADELLASLDGRLARFKQPRRIVVVDALPRNAMGKVQKDRLRALYSTAMEA